MCEYQFFIDRCCGFRPPCWLYIVIAKIISSNTFQVFYTQCLKYELPHYAFKVSFTPFSMGRLMVTMKLSKLSCVITVQMLRLIEFSCCMMFRLQNVFSIQSGEACISVFSPYTDTPSPEIQMPLPALLKPTPLTWALA